MFGFKDEKISTNAGQFNLIRWNYLDNHVSKLTSLGSLLRIVAWHTTRRQLHLHEYGEKIKIFYGENLLGVPE